MRANPEQAAMAWLRSITSLEAGKVATRLPDPGTFAGDTGGFLVVTSLGGLGNGLDYPVRRIAVQVDAYAGTAQTPVRPLFARATALAEEVLAGCEAFTPVSIVSGYTDVDDVIVMQATALAEPSRVRDDPQNLARYTIDVELTYR